MGVFSGFKRNEPEKTTIKKHQSLKGTKIEKIDEAERRAKILLNNENFQNWICEKFGGESADITISLGVKTQGLHMIVLDLKKFSEEEGQFFQLPKLEYVMLKTMHIKQVDYVFMDGVVDWVDFEFNKEYMVENKDRYYITIDPSLAGVDEGKIKEAQKRATSLLSHGGEFEEMVNKNTSYDNEGRGKTTVSLDIPTQRDYYLALECTMFEGFFEIPSNVVNIENLEHNDKEFEEEESPTYKIVSKHKNKIDIIPPADFDWSLNPKGKVFII